MAEGDRRPHTRQHPLAEDLLEPDFDPNEMLARAERSRRAIYTPILQPTATREDSEQVGGPGRLINAAAENFGVRTANTDLLTSDTALSGPTLMTSPSVVVGNNNEINLASSSGTTLSSATPAVNATIQMSNPNMNTNLNHEPRDQGHLQELQLLQRQVATLQTALFHRENGSASAPNNLTNNQSSTSFRGEANNQSSTSFRDEANNPSSTSFRDATNNQSSTSFRGETNNHLQDRAPRASSLNPRESGTSLLWNSYPEPHSNRDYFPQANPLDMYPRQTSQSSLTSRSSFGEPRIRSPEYDGKTDWKGFAMQFKMISRQYQWPVDEMLKRFISSLKGDALQYVAQLPQRFVTDIHNLLEVMEQRFGDPVLPETYRARLTGLKKEPKETLREYEARVRRLMSKAYPGLEGADFFHTLAVEYLCNGLPDPNMAFDILVKKPKTIRQAIDLIEWYDSCRNSTKKKSQIRAISTGYESSNALVPVEGPEVRRMFVTEERLQQFGREIVDQIKKVLVLKSDAPKQPAIAPAVAAPVTVRDTPRFSQTSPPTSSTAQPYRTRRDPSTVTCYNCRGLGHYASTCPKPRATVRELVLDVLDSYEEYEEYDMDDQMVRPANDDEDEEEDTTEMQENC